MTNRLNRSRICPILVGRGAELALLGSLIDEAAQRRARAALLWGEAGIGKSRLMAQVMDMARACGFAVFQAACFETDASCSYAPLSDSLRALPDAHCPAASADRQEPLLRELVRLLPDLAVAFPMHTPDTPPQPLDPAQHRRRLCAVLTQLLREHAAHQPILLAIEDAHWCDEDSLAVLLHLVRHCTDLPLVFLCSYRAEDMSPHLGHWLAHLRRERTACELELLPLAPPEVAVMLQAIFATAQPAPATLVDFICSQTEGNPLFVEEVLQSLIATGRLRYLNDTWEWSSIQSHPADPAVVSRTVQDVVQQRVRRLSPPAREALTVASVVGQRFDISVVRQALRCDEPLLLLIIKELIASHFIAEETADRFVFRHALIHRAISGMLLARERQSLHRTLADAFEALAADPGRRELYLPELARHCYAAGLWPQALEYGHLAGERAMARYAPDAALEYLTYAFDAAGQLGVTPPGALCAARGHAYATRGDFERARADYEQACRAARATLDGATEWQSMVALGSLWSGRDYATAGAWFRRANDLAAQLAIPLLQAHSLNHVGNWLVNVGRIEEGLLAHGEALIIFQDQDHQPGMAETHDLLGIAYGMLGDRVLAVAHLSRAVELFHTLEHTPRLIASLAMRAIQSMPGACETTLSPLRTRDACIQDAEEALALARRIAALADQAFAENALAHTLLAFGEVGSALAHALAGERIAAAIDHPQWRVALQYGVGQAYLCLLAPAQAVEALTAGVALARELGSPFWIATLTAALARAYLLDSDMPAAQAALGGLRLVDQLPQNIAERTIALVWGELLVAQGEARRALQIAEQLLGSVPGARSGVAPQPVPHLLKLKGDALLALAQPDAAVPALMEARQGALARNTRPLLWTIHRALGSAFQALGRPEQALQELATARDVIAELGMTIDHPALRGHFVRAALATLPQSPASSETVRRAYGGLTAREREVATLIVQGRTSREIAEQLVISERTAETHVSNILGKLNFRSRAQIAAWAAEIGLHRP